MTVENEIKLAKIEKQLNEAVDAIMTELNIPEVLDEAAALNLRYSKLGNELMESDYSDFLLDIAKNGVKTIEEAYCISYIIAEVANLSFDSDLFATYLYVIIAGISAGFALGFISWGIGYAIYGIIRFIKMS